VLAQLVDELRYVSECSIPDGVTGIFIDIILPAALWPEVDSACNRNEYQEYFVGGKVGRCVGLTTFICRQMHN